MAIGDDNQLFRAVFEGARDAMLVADEAGRYLDVNSAACALFGVSREELIGKTAGDFAAPGFDFAQAWREYLRVGVMRGELTLERKDGTQRLADVSVSRISPEAHLSVLRDVTEQKEVNARLALADRLLTIGTLAAGIAHEINNPLSYVVANIALALQEMQALGPTADDAVTALSDARQGAERVRLIVRDLKMFSRSDDERPTPVDVRRPIESAITMTWNEIRHRARLVKDFEEVPPVRGTEGKLGQVFLNLLVNAAQAIDEGAADRNEIRVSVRASGEERVLVEVKDSGRGMPREIAGRVFEPFFTTKHAQGGTGLGLAICRDILSKLGGEISVFSEPGKGTTFSVLLPVMQGEPERATPPPGLPRSARRGRVLVVDDEQLVATGIRRTLAAEHDVVTFTRGRDAIAWLRDGNVPDVVLLDVMMPEMNGMEVFYEIVRLLPQLEARTMFVSGGAFTPAAAEFFARNRNARMDKPFDADALRDAVRRLMAQ